MLFKLHGKTATRIEPDDKRIREEVIHQMMENNLEQFFDLTFVCSKQRVDGKEIDTLAFNPQSRAPVILEYKRGKDRQVVAQIAEYLAKLKNNKLVVMESFRGKNITDHDGEIDFENPEVFVVAKDFTPDQVQAFSQLKVLPRLFRFQFYANDIVSLEEVGVEESRTTHRKNHPTIGPNTLDHFHMNPATRALYELLDKGITKLDSRVKPAKINKHFIGFGATGNYFCTVKPIAKELNVFVKCKRNPAKTTGLEIMKLLQGRWKPMTHTFKIAVREQVPPALRIIRSAMEDSI